jgi:hypothetical protein
MVDAGSQRGRDARTFAGRKFGSVKRKPMNNRERTTIFCQRGT